MITMPRPLADTSKKIRSKWNALTLSRQFALAGSLVIVIGMIVVGSWVSRQIEEGVTRNSAVATALYVDSFIAPLAQELTNNKALSIGPIRALDEAFQESPLGKRLVTVKIWKKDGTILYSTNYDLIGKKFTPTEQLKAAWSGEVAVGYGDIEEEENASERLHGIPLLEIYSPIRAPWTGEIIAVAEFYENATALKATLASARYKSALVFAAVALTMALMLMGIVHRGSQTIENQREKLRLRLDEATRASEQNQRLKERVQRASERVAELNEQYLNRTGAELHDGPAQLLALASLRLDSLRKENDPEKRARETAVIKGALDDAMSDIRNLCRGLTLPDIAELSIQDIIKRVVLNHEERSRTDVTTEAEEESIPANHSIKICVYRFVQEALNNAWQHGKGIDQKVIYSFEKETQLLTVKVSDGGKGIINSQPKNSQGGLGLVGLRERIESVGGALKISSRPDDGTQLTMSVIL